MHPHETVVCSCGAVIMQCRCPATDKPKRVIENGCAKCAAAAGIPQAIELPMPVAHRTFRNVVERVMAVLPPSWNHLRLKLQSLRDSGEFTAPEAMGYRWEQLATILGDAIGDPPGFDWGEKIGRIVRGEE